MKDLAVHATLATAMLRDQLGSKNDTCFQDTRTEGVGLDMSIAQGEKGAQSR